MKRNIDIEELRRFFDTCIHQFDETNIRLHSVRFIRDEDGNLADIHLNYTETETIIQADEKKPL